MKALKTVENDGSVMISLPIFNILVTITPDGGGGAITSTIQEESEDYHGELYNASIDGIESMILAHACAGVDITTTAYIMGIETAVQACANNY